MQDQLLPHGVVSFLLQSETTHQHIPKCNAILLSAQAQFISENNHELKNSKKR